MWESNLPPHFPSHFSHTLTFTILPHTHFSHTLTFTSHLTPTSPTSSPSPTPLVHLHTHDAHPHPHTPSPLTNLTDYTKTDGSSPDTPQSYQETGYIERVCVCNGGCVCVSDGGCVCVSDSGCVWVMAVVCGSWRLCVGHGDCV